MQAIVLAGQENVALASVSTVRYEAEVLIGGRPMGEWVISALKDAQSISEVVLVGPPSLQSEGVLAVAPGSSLWESLNAGLSRLTNPSERVLIVTGDIPLITGMMVDDFVQASPVDADLVYPVISKINTLAKFPETKRTYVKLMGITVTGGNMVVANPLILPKVEERAKVLISHRKAPLRLARDVGILLLLRLLTGRLSLAEAERRVSQVFGVKGRVMECPYPEVGVDVDKVSDWSMVERVFTQSRSSAIEIGSGG
jgi:GTP:adenosylcobinamide-phosphate guanylyltransferase